MRELPPPLGSAESGWIVSAPSQMSTNRGSRVWRRCRPWLRQRALQAQFGEALEADANYAARGFVLIGTGEPPPSWHLPRVTGEWCEVTLHTRRPMKVEF